MSLYWVLIALVLVYSGATDGGTSARWLSQEFRSEVECKAAATTIESWSQNRWPRATVQASCFKR